MRPTDWTTPASVAPALLMLLSLAALSGCMSLGPQRIEVDSFDYSNALRTSAQQQLLLNALALRYSEVPMFLDVSSVISSFAVEGSVNAGANWSSGWLAGDGQNLGVAGRYREQPTITYTPRVGDKFTRSLLSPIPPVSLFGLVQSGWPISAIFRLAVRSMNGVSSYSRLRFLGGEGDAEFAEMIEAMQRVQYSKKLDFRIEKTEDGPVAVMFLAKELDAETARDVAYLRALLGLAPGTSEFSLVYGRTPRGGDEIAVLTKSMLEILSELGAAVDVPLEHLGEGRVPYTVAHSAEVAPLVKILSSKDRPEDAMTAVRFRDYWFYISDRDVASKRAFMIVGLLLSLAETGSVRTAPVVTIPAS